MKMDTFYGNTKLLCSEEAEDGAERLIEKIENGTLGMNIFPNRYEKFSRELEEKDFVAYCRFMESSNGRKVLEMLETEDAEIQYL